MNTFKQIAAVTAVNLRTVPQRLGTSMVIVVGIAGVVAVLVSVLAMSVGMIKTMQNSGREDRAIVLRNGSAAEFSSALPPAAVREIIDSPGIKLDSDGQPIATGELLRLVSMIKKDDGTEVNSTIRGIGPRATSVRPEIKIVEGRMFRPAVNEFIVGRGAQKQFKNLEIGNQITTRSATWTVVGVFTTDGDSHESELMTDRDTLASAYRAGGYNSVTVVLNSAQSFAQFKDALSANPAVSVDVMRERDYYARQSKTLTDLLNIVAYVVGGIMAVGAFFGALNAMYSVVSARASEIATLRAIGFGATATVVSVLVESLLLAALGGVVGAILAWFFFNGNTVSTGGTAQGNLVFDLAVSPQLAIVGIVWACSIGLIGGLFPAIRAARLPVATALRAV
jgi:putative ABC transport system permease protein